MFLLRVDHAPDGHVFAGHEGVAEAPAERIAVGASAAAIAIPVNAARHRPALSTHLPPSMRRVAVVGGVRIAGVGALRAQGHVSGVLQLDRNADLASGDDLGGGEVYTQQGNTWLAPPVMVMGVLASTLFRECRRHDSGGEFHRAGFCPAHLCRDHDVLLARPLFVGASMEVLSPLLLKRLADKVAVMSVRKSTRPRRLSHPGSGRLSPGGPEGSGWTGQRRSLPQP